MTQPLNWHFAALWESIADFKPSAEALVDGDQRLTWREFDDRAARLASCYQQLGLLSGSKVAIYSFNCAEYLIAQYAAFKSGICPVNVNYRYLQNELTYLITNSDAELVVYQSSFADRLVAIQGELPKVRAFIEIGESTAQSTELRDVIAFQDAWQNQPPQPRRTHESNDIYMIYTGGTTGNPKGVMYEQGIFSQLLTSLAMQYAGLEAPERPENVIDGIASLDANGLSPRSIPACPLMHGTGMWIGALMPLSIGGTVVVYDNRSFSAEALLSLAEREHVTEMAIVGDAFATPITDELARANERNRPYQLDAMRRISSSGVMFSSETKAKLLQAMDITIVDSMGASEGTFASSVINRANVNDAKTANFQLSPLAKVLKEDGTEVVPGSGETGLLCSALLVPLGYYKDPVKSDATFKTINGVRYTVPGDYARIEADGSIVLLGRGSTCINSGGEKIYPEEVEEAMKSHPEVYDCLVVGLPDPKFGQAVTAVYSIRANGATDPAALKDYIRSNLADYKAPKHYVQVDAVPRAVNGKADYKTAKQMAEDAVNSKH